MSRRVNQVHQILLAFNQVEQGNGTGLQGDALLLLVLLAVNIPELSRQPRGYDPIGGQQAVSQTGLAIVHMGQDADVADVLHGVLQLGQLVSQEAGHDDGVSLSKVSIVFKLSLKCCGLGSLYLTIITYVIEYI